MKPTEEMNDPIVSIKKRIEPLRQDIIHHKVYAAIRDIDDLQVFMRYHVYAVWDFMSLLKTLQNNLTCTQVPWFPKGSADTRFLINEIVVGEESDVDENGVRKSHYEIYLDAMRQCGADTSAMETFSGVLQKTGDFSLAFQQAETPAEAQEFTDFTFRIIGSGKPHLQAAIFTFGREDLIPGMFLSLVKDLHRKFPESISTFTYYLERHIEVDGDHHSHLALEMTSKLCGNDPGFWEEAEEAVVESLKKRITLWDGVYRELMSRKSPVVKSDMSAGLIS